MVGHLSSMLKALSSILSIISFFFFFNNWQTFLCP